MRFDTAAIFKSKISKLFEAISEGLKSDVIVSCGAGWTDIIAHRVLSAFGKPVICFNHGYVPFENEINGLGYSDRTVKAIIKHLRTADLIVANSSSRRTLLRNSCLNAPIRLSTLALGSKGLNNAASKANVKISLLLAGAPVQLRPTK